MKGAHKPSLSIFQKCLSFIISFYYCPILSDRALPAFAQTGSMQQPAIEQNYQPRSYQGQLEADDGQWIRPAKDYASTRYSSLDQINAKNAKDLKLAFTFSTGMTHGHEAAPLVVNNTMYIVTPFPNNLYALDLTKPGAPMKWVYEPLPTPASQGVACCDVVNRGAAYDDGKIYYNTLDNQTVAVDANTRSRSLENARWRHQQGREHDHGSAGSQRESSGRKQRRRIRSSWLADSAGWKDRENRLESLHRRAG